MTDVSIFETTNQKPLIIQTTRSEMIIVRALPAPGPKGDSGLVSLVIDGGGPETSFGSIPLIDGGTP